METAGRSKVSSSRPSNSLGHGQYDDDDYDDGLWLTRSSSSPALPGLVWSGLVCCCLRLLACLPACLSACLSACLPVCLPTDRALTCVCVHLVVVPTHAWLGAPGSIMPDRAQSSSTSTSTAARDSGGSGRDGKRRRILLDGSAADDTTALAAPLLHPPPPPPSTAAAVSSAVSSAPEYSNPAPASALTEPSHWPQSSHPPTYPDLGAYSQQPYFYQQQTSSIHNHNNSASWPTTTTTEPSSYSGSTAPPTTLPVAESSSGTATMPYFPPSTSAHAGDMHDGVHAATTFHYSDVDPAAQYTSFGQSTHARAVLSN